MHKYLLKFNAVRRRERMKGTIFVEQKQHMTLHSALGLLRRESKAFAKEWSKPLDLAILAGGAIAGNVVDGLVGTVQVVGGVLVLSEVLRVVRGKTALMPIPKVVQISDAFTDADKEALNYVIIGRDVAILNAMLKNQLEPQFRTTEGMPKGLTAYQLLANIKGRFGYDFSARTFARDLRRPCEFSVDGSPVIISRLEAQAGKRRARKHYWISDAGTELLRRWVEAHSGKANMQDLAGLSEDSDKLVDEDVS